MRNLDRHLCALGPIAPAPLDTARARWNGIRAAYGLADHAHYLSEPEYNAKLAHTAHDTDVWVTSLALAPAGQSEVANTCTYSTAACRLACVGTTGRGGMAFVQRVRAARTLFLSLYPADAVALIIADIGRHHARYGSRLRVRLNAFSDIRWERAAPAIFATYPTIPFYDYTKWSARRRPDAQLPTNYRLTRSASERTTTAAILDHVDHGRTVAVVFASRKGEPLPATWHGRPVIDGDATDDRSADPAGVIVGLRVKGRHAQDAITSGFARPTVTGGRP